MGPVLDVGTFPWKGAVAHKTCLVIQVLMQYPNECLSLLTRNPGLYNSARSIYMLCKNVYKACKNVESCKNLGLAFVTSCACSVHKF